MQQLYTCCMYEATHLGERMAFVLPSLLGLIWIIPWLWFYRDRKSVSTTTAPIPVMQLLRIPEVWGAMLARGVARIIRSGLALMGVEAAEEMR